MVPTPVIETPRLTLFVPPPEDAERCVRFNRDNAEFLRPWEPPMPKSALDPVRMRDMRALAVSEALSGAAYSFAFAARGAGVETPILGWCTISRLTRGIFQCGTLGYKLDKLSQGQGYMTEALTGLTGYLFSEVRLHRIEAAYMPHNQRSAAVLRRLGFTIEGTARAYLFIGGAWRDHVLTSLTNPDDSFSPM